MHVLFSIRPLACAGALLLVGTTVLAQSVDGPLPAEKARETFRLEPGLRIELVAAEPMIESPVAIAFDERGGLFVAENRGYPTGPPGRAWPPAGRIARLEDTDGDGKMDRRTEFADGLTFPNGLMPWRGGLIVTCAPDIFYLRDTDGDGRADERLILFTGFDTGGSTQLRVSHPTLSPDNWIYTTIGLRTGKVTSPFFPDRPPVELKRSDFRFRPDGDAWEPADGVAAVRPHVRRFRATFHLLQSCPGSTRRHLFENVAAQPAPGVLRNDPELSRGDRPGVLEGTWRGVADLSDQQERDDGRLPRRHLHRGMRGDRLSRPRPARFL